MEHIGVAADKNEIHLQTISNENGQGSPLSQKKPQLADIAVEAANTTGEPLEHIGAAAAMLGPEESEAEASGDEWNGGTQRLLKHTKEHMG